MGLVCQSGAISLSSNGNYQTESSVFSQQSNGAVDERVQRFGGQDKTALRAVPVPSRQPEPLRSSARSRGVSNKPQRPKKLGTSRRKTVHLVLWVNPIVKPNYSRSPSRKGSACPEQGAHCLAVPSNNALICSTMRF